MRRRFALAVAAIMLASVLAAQSTPAPTKGRKVLFRSAPSYPDIAKKMHIQGTVKIEATVRANGIVKSTRVIGGSPVLVQAAVEAVSRWKFESAQNDTIEVVQVNFDDQ